jgi:hypothetical protein
MGRISNSPKESMATPLRKAYLPPPPSEKPGTRSLEYRKFLSLTDGLVDVNRKICRLRPVEQAQQTAQEKKRRKPFSKRSPAK